MNVCRIRKHGVGEVSSKYGYDKDGSQFEADMKAHYEKGEALYKEFVEWMKTKDVSPDTFRNLFLRFYEELME